MEVVARVRAVEEEHSLPGKGPAHRVWRSSQMVEGGRVRAVEGGRAVVGAAQGLL